MHVEIKNIIKKKYINKRIDEDVNKMDNRADNTIHSAAICGASKWLSDNKIQGFKDKTRLHKKKKTPRFC